MKYVRWGGGLILTLLVTLLVLQYVASERIEVVELHAADEAGEEVITRLWVVDDEGFQYLRVGADGSGWYDRIQANESIKVTRNGETQHFQVTPRPDKRDEINDLMQAKYTWGDTLIGILVGSREGSIPLQLQPL